MSLPTGTVTFLFTDTEGSTRLLQHLGDARAAEVFEEHRRLLRDAIASGGGHELQDQGDGFLFVFLRAYDGVLAAVAAQQGINTHSWPRGAKLQVRMGLHTGEPITTAEGYVGVDVHRAARICAAGYGGQILLSQTTRALVEPDLPASLGLRDLGAHSLKDLARPEHIFQVVGKDLRSDFPALRSLTVLPNNLPIQMTSFVGREREMAEVKRLLGTSHLLTLSGFGGCGKTRLALQVAADVLEEYPEGVWLAELADVSDPAVVPQVVASALGVREEPGRTLTATLSHYFHERRLLLILDNCEHVIAACAQLAEILLGASPHLSILATSRESLGIAGETTWRVPALSLPDLRNLPSIEELAHNEAVRLFVERAVTASPGFAATVQNAPAVAQICHRLEGIPLAIELAAAQLRVLSVPRIATRLDDGLRMLPGGRRTADRHQTLHAVMQWSYALLSEPERIMLRSLSVFAGSFTLEAVEVICAGDGIEKEAVLDLLTRLVDKSLVFVDQQNGESRYRLLDTVRRYSGEKLEEANEAKAVRSRHTDWYVALARRAAPMLQVSQEWLDRLEAEHSNLRGVLDWCKQTQDWHEALRLSAPLRRFWLVRGFWTEGRRWLEEALANVRDAPLPLRAEALGAAASLAQHQADYDRAVILSEESLAIYRALGDKSGIADALTTLGNVLFERGDYAEARRVHEEGLACGRDADDKWLIGASLVNLANVVMHQGDFEWARALCQESLVVFQQAGDKRGLAFALNILGLIAHDQGDFVAARKPFEEALAVQRQLGDKRGIAISLTNLGLLAWELGDYDAAVSLYEEALAIRRQLGDERGVATLLYYLGQVALRQGVYLQATSLFSESLVMRKAAGNKAGVARSLEGLARATRRFPQRAARLFGAVAAIQETVGEVRSQPEQVEYERDLNAVRTELGVETFSVTWNEGRAMTLDQAVEYALVSVAPLSNTPLFERPSQAHPSESTSPQ